MQLDKNFIKRVIPEANFLYAEFPQSPEFSIDTRTLKKGDIFVALPGTKTDGHEFIKAAIECGAAGCVIAQDKIASLEKTCDKKSLEKIAIVAVPNPYNALIALATAWRALLSCKVIDITGSVGKTSTKQITAQLLQLAGVPHLVSSGNQNTALGICLNLLKVREAHKVVLLETGINKRGEMARLAEISKPTAAVITAIGHSHMEGLGSIIDIAAEKRDIFKLFKEDSIGIINGDLPLLANVAYPHPVIKFGCKTTNQIQARKIQIGTDHTQFVLKLYGEKFVVKLQTNHKGSVYNALAAAAVGYLLNIPSKTIVEGISQPLLVPGRFEKRSLKQGKGILINDCYNASPESMKAALLAFQSMKTGAQKVAVLGDMLELGVNSPFWHRQLGRFLRKVPSLRQVILVGSHVVWTKKTVPLGVKVDMVANWQEAVPYLQEKLALESIVLVKGSNGMGLSNLVQEFAEDKINLVASAA